MLENNHQVQFLEIFKILYKYNPLVDYLLILFDNLTRNKMKFNIPLL